MIFFSTVVCNLIFNFLSKKSGPQHNRRESAITFLSSSVSSGCPTPTLHPDHTKQFPFQVSCAINPDFFSATV